MKTTVLVSCLLFISCHIFGQDITRYVLKIDSVPNLKAQDSIHSSIKKDTLLKNVMLENWDTINFNPFKHETKKLPFLITFTDSTYSAPIERKQVVTSRYGWRNRRPHRGIDIDLITGDSVFAMFDGKVRFVNYSSGHGKTVVIRHFNGLETAYAHLSKYLVNVNDTIKKGQIIGKGGTTGNARGSHLHLVVSYRGIAINPEYLFEFNSGNKIRAQNIWVTKEWVTPYMHSSKRQSDIIPLDTYEKVVANQKKQKQVYIIKAGDTLSEISSKYRIPIRRICQTNKISRTSTLRIGQKLILAY